jgi:outer membrane murein-binding lipoprotein Lpp
MAGWADIIQIVISVVTGFISALVAVGVLTLRISNMIGSMTSRQDRLEGKFDAMESSITLQMERADNINRSAIMDTVQKVAVHPVEKLESRVGALEQDMAVVRFQLKARAYFFPPPVREIGTDDNKD